MTTISIQAEKKQLTDSLAFASKAIAAKSNHPILSNFLIAFSEEKQEVEVTGFDLATRLSVVIPGTCSGSGAICAPAKVLADIVGMHPNDMIEIKVNTESKEIAISSSSGKYQFLGMDAEEYPEMPVITEGREIEVDAEAILQGLKGTLFTASHDETKQILNGVHLKIRQNTLEFASTDGHRLSVVSVKTATETGGNDSAITVAARPLAALVEKLLKGKKGDGVTVRLIFDETGIIIKFNEYQIIGRVVQGHYPLYDRLMPRDFTGQASVSRKEFLAATERVAVISRDNTIRCDFDLKNQETTLSIDAQELGSGSEKLDMKITSDSSKIKPIVFNTKYLSEALKNLSPFECVTVFFTFPNHPVVISPVVDNSGEAISIKYMIMPIQSRA